ncbi:MAG TPA: hypothetical protein VE093_13135 [Polyangiaceae bacterium]|nr:hypothetical protein [Polyangiaceae bacterium]
MSAREVVRFFGWCSDADKLDAFVAAVSALHAPEWPCKYHQYTLGTREEVYRSELSAEEVIALVRAKFTNDSTYNANVPVRGPSGWANVLGIEFRGREYGSERFPSDPLSARVYAEEFYERFLHVAYAIDKRSITLEAAILSILILEKVEDILVRFCAPDDSKRVPTGGASGAVYYWGAPLELAATYNADGNVARDVALSWLHLHDGDLVGYIAGTSLDALAARVEAAPKGATVGVATKLDRVDEHETLDRQAAHHPASRGTHVGAIRRVPRDRLPGDVDLTREQVLKVLETPPTTLLEALEAAAVPDDEWRSAEPLALEALAAKAEGAPTVEVEVNTDRHRRFIERHAPYRVRRLPNGGVLLATHPYRTLWQLWADALDLVGIRTSE